MTVSHTASFNPAEVSCVGPPVNPTPVCFTGTTTQTWVLRPDLKFHDGLPVLADDAAYSILASRDVPAALLSPFVSNVATHTCNVALVAGACPAANLVLIPGASAVGNPASSRTLSVKLILSSPLYELNIGNDIPIIPKHIWQPICGNMPLAAGGGPCSNPAVDPMCPTAPACNTGYFIGSGPWICTGVTGTAAAGHIGGSCDQNADGSLGGQTTSVGGRVLLTANPDYMRGPTRLIGSKYQLFSWADEANTGTVDINDLAKAAVDFCKNPAVFPGPGCPADAYFGNPLLGVPGQVNINDIATIATYFDVSLTSPIAPAQLLNLDPVIDYFDYSMDPASILSSCVQTGVNVVTCYTLSSPSGGEAMTMTDGIGSVSGTEFKTNIVDPYHCGVVATPCPTSPIDQRYFEDTWTFTFTVAPSHLYHIHYTPGTGVNPADPTWCSPPGPCK
jgi:hypothetical protein